MINVSGTVVISYTNGQNARSEGVETDVRQCGPNGENRRKLGALAETPRARGTKTSRCELAERTRMTMDEDGDGRWWRTISVMVVGL